jgi:hypothetical protein
MFDFVAVEDRSTSASASSSTTCTSTSSIRSASLTAVAPRAPGYSIEIRPESLSEFAFGPVWS